MLLLNYAIGLLYVCPRRQSGRNSHKARIAHDAQRILMEIGKIMCSYIIDAWCIVQHDLPSELKELAEYAQ